MQSALEHSIVKLLDERPIPAGKIVSEISDAACLGRESDLPIASKIAHLDDMMDEIIAYPAMALLPGWKEAGVEVLCRMAIEGPHYATALSVLAVIAMGRVPTGGDVHFLPDSWEKLCKYTVDVELTRLALRNVRKVVLDQLTDTYQKSRLLSAIAHQAMFQPDKVGQEERLNFLMDMLIDSQMILNKEILEGFERLLEQSPEREEKLHKFLIGHPVLLDPFVTELRSKHELGDDFITDFVIRRSNDEYVLVEIENSTDRLFNQNGTFSAELNAAIGQVRDFQAWVSENIAYARKKLPDIAHPEGLVVIGRRIGLLPDMQKRLAEENFSRRGHIKIITYDDLLAQAHTVYRNALERPVILRSRDHKAI